jgi:hypothetical protein
LEGSIWFIKEEWKLSIKVSGKNLFTISMKNQLFGKILRKEKRKAKRIELPLSLPVPSG